MYRGPGVAQPRPIYCTASLVPDFWVGPGDEATACTAGLEGAGGGRRNVIQWVELGRTRN